MANKYPAIEGRGIPELFKVSIERFNANSIANVNIAPKPMDASQSPKSNFSRSIRLIFFRFLNTRKNPNRNPITPTTL